MTGDVFRSLIALYENELKHDYIVFEHYQDELCRISEGKDVVMEGIMETNTRIIALENTITNLMSRIEGAPTRETVAKTINRLDQDIESICQNIVETLNDYKEVISGVIPSTISNTGYDTVEDAQAYLKIRIRRLTEIMFGMEEE